ncbi:MAG: hypothetical protein JRE23_00090 [Deltaproteobacteria bacterium]|nr:hypothetical protein [Deltaproteobacteria bacterium]
MPKDSVENQEETAESGRVQPIVICDVCKYWERPTDKFSEGECQKLREKVEVEVEAGMEGYSLIAFFTEKDFGCILGLHI